MTIESFIGAMPKVEVNLRLEGAIDPQVLITIAEQNDVPLTAKPNKGLVKLLTEPDLAELDDLVRRTSKWLQQPEDFTRVVYELGVSLAKQNVRYAEVSIAPTLYAENGLTFEQLLTALNDGRTRVERAWNVHIRWVLTAFRDEPRKFDDVIRWASSPAAVKGGVLGIGLIGRETKGWVGEFARPFRTAQKKELPHFVEVFETVGDVPQIIQEYAPERVISAGNIAESDDTIHFMTDKQIALGLCMAHSVRGGTAASYSAFPLRRLFDDGAIINLGTWLPSIYHTSLVQEYSAAVMSLGFSIEELEQIALNAIAASFLPDDRKVTMAGEFREAYARLSSEHGVVLSP